jgi:outer membrane translocation and assembly module TamA
VPALYRNRMTVTPVLKFAITPHLSVGGGVSVTELDALDESSDEARMANAAVGLVNFSQRWRETSSSYHGLDATFSVRAGTDALESDLVYERYLAESFYGFRRNHHRVLASAMFGGISGEAPLFERFSLGDSRTLRGWDKRDIAPAGGDRMFHASLEYRYRVLALFLDSGSVWDSGRERRVRFSSGVGLSAGPWFATVGFPINTDEFRAVFTTGVRFGWWWSLPRLNRADTSRWRR